MFGKGLWLFGPVKSLGVNEAAVIWPLPPVVWICMPAKSPSLPKRVLTHLSDGASKPSTNLLWRVETFDEPVVSWLQKRISLNVSTFVVPMPCEVGGGAQLKPTGLLLLQVPENLSPPI